MPFTVKEIWVADIQSVRYRDSPVVRTESSMSMDSGVLTIDSLPAELSWRVTIDVNSSETSTVTCAANVRRPDGVDEPAGHLSRIVSGSDLLDVSLPPFKATVTGTYTVRVVFTAPESITSSVPIEISLRKR